MPPTTILEHQVIAEGNIRNAFKVLTDMKFEAEVTRDGLWNRVNFAIGVLERKEGYPQYSMQQLADHLKQELERHRNREQQFLDRLAATNK